MYILKLYLTALVVFFAIDMLWLGVVAKNLYQKYIGYLLSPQPNWIAAFVFYAIYIGGVCFFVIHPALEKGSWQYALLVGALFGFITYATYDLTNLATVKDWPITITLIDLAWGTTLGASVSTVTYFIAKALKL